MNRFNSYIVNFDAFQKRAEANWAAPNWSQICFKHEFFKLVLCAISQLAIVSPEGSEEY